MAKKKVTLSIDAKTYANFQEYCEENAVLLSKKIELFMENFLKHSKRRKVIYSFFACFFSIFFVMSFASAANVFFDGFESGGLGSWNLTSASGANNWTGSTTNPYQGTYHAQSNPQSTTEPASVLERTISTSGYENITFNYQRRLISIDAADEFKVKWYNGTNWTILEETLAGSADDANYSYKNFSLSSGANNNGNFMIRFECTAGAVSEYCRVDNVEINGTALPVVNSAPSITLNLPSNNSAINNSQNVNFNFTAVDDINTTLSCSIYLDGSSNMTNSSTLNNTLTNFAISGISYGNHNWQINCTDGSLTNASETRIFSINDTISPAVSFASPTETSGTTLFTRQNILVNFTASDSGQGLKNLTIRLYNSTGLINSTNSSNSPLALNFSGLANNIYFFNATACDNFGNCNNSETRNVTITYDITSPSISLVYPQNLTYNVNISSLNYTVSDANLQACWYSTNLGVANTTVTCGTNVTELTSTEGSNSWKIWANDSAGNINSSAITFSKDTILPTITIANPENKTYGTKSGLPLDYSVADSNGISSCWYSFDGGTNTTLSGCANTTFSVSSDGSHNIRIYANDTSNNVNSSIRYFSVDSTSPIWSNMQNSTPSNYSSSTLSMFNITWTDGSSSIGSVLFESNFSGSAVNYSMYLISGSVYGFNATLPAGTFYWRSYANDSLGNLNSSESRTFTIGKASPTISLLLDGVASDKTITYGATSNASGSESNSGDGDLTYSLYRNGASVSNPETTILGAGTYVYIYNTSGGANYSVGNISRTLTIDKAASSISLFLNGTESNASQTYGSSVNATAVGTNGVPILYRGGIAVSNPEIISLGAGFYNYTATIEEGANISRSAKTFFLNVTKASPTLSLLINGVDSDISVSIGNFSTINASATSPSGAIVYLHENNAFESSGANPSATRNYSTLGNRIWKVNISESENYTYGEKEHTLSVIDSSFPSYSNLKENPSDPATYSTSGVYRFNATWTDNIGIDNVILSFNGVNYSFSNGNLSRNGDEYYRNFSSLAAGTYSYKWYANDTSGNLVATPNQSYTIDKSVAALFLTMSPGSSVSYGTATEVTCTSNNAESSPALTRNSTSVSNPDINTFGVNSYSYACTSAATQNYTSASTTGTLTVVKASPTISLLIDGADSDKSATTGSTINITARLVSPSSGIINLSENSVLINSGLNVLENITVYGSIGTFALTALYGGNENYSSGNKNHTITISAPSSGGSGGGGGGGSKKIIAENTTNSSTENKFEFGIPGITIEPVAPIIVNPGENKKISLNIKNSGTTFLDKCKVAGRGVYSSWIASDDVKDLSIGQKLEFLSSLNVPNDMGPGKYQVEFSVICQDAMKMAKMDVEIIQKKLDLKLVSAQRGKDGALAINYSLLELAGEGQDVSVQLVLVNARGDKVAEIVEGRTIGADSINTFESVLNLSNSVSESNLNLLINANSKIASAFVQEYIVLDSSRISGFTLFGGEGKGNLAVASIVIAFLVFAFFIGRRIARFSSINKRKHIISAIHRGINSHQNRTHAHEGKGNA